MLLDSQMRKWRVSRARLTTSFSLGSVLSLLPTGLGIPSRLPLASCWLHGQTDRRADGRHVKRVGCRRDRTLTPALSPQLLTDSVSLTQPQVRTETLKNTPRVTGPGQSPLKRTDSYQPLKFHGELCREWEVGRRGYGILGEKKETQYETSYCTSHFTKFWFRLEMKPRARLQKE